MLHPPPPLGMSLEEWQTDISYHLEMIEAFAQFIETHSRDILAVPDWETKAGDRLLIAETVLTLALERITNARKRMAEKPHAA